VDQPPAALPATREALHRLVAYVVSPFREQHTGRIGLRSLGGRFGTPRVGDGEVVVAIEGAEIVRSTPAGEERFPITSLAAASTWLGVPLDPTRADRFDVPPAGDVEAPLDVDADASRWLAELFDFGADALDALRGAATVADDAGDTQLWPEHFDLAIAAGDESTGARATFGFCPGDRYVPEPYVYVSPWERDGLDDAFFPGGGFASLTIAAVLADPDPRGATLAFLRQGRDILRARRPNS
jgi:hypothetical protein